MMFATGHLRNRNKNIMNRRQINKALALAPLSCLVGLPSLATASGKASTAEPTRQDPSRPFRRVDVGEDGRRVLFFFDFACPFCAEYHSSLMNFQSSVPKQIQTQLIPVVNPAEKARKNDLIAAAKCFYAVQDIASREQVRTFVSNVYSMYPETRSLMNQNMWIRAMKAAGIDVNRFANAMQSPANNQQVMFAARKTAAYDLRATPSVAVGGKYVMTPDDVMGDKEMFFNILNGLTSEIL